MFKADLHTHTKYSPDSMTEPRDTVIAAINAGLNEIAITDHFDPYMADKDFSYYDRKSYFKDIEALREEFSSKIRISAGIEIGQSHIYTQNCENVVSEGNYDYVIGSLHNIAGDVDIAFIDYEKTDINSMLRQYYKELLQVAKCDCYDCMGHLDYPKRYVFKHHLKYYTRDYLDMIEEILKTVIAKGKGIEINTSGYNYYPAYTMPSMEVLRIYKSLGGEIVTTGSDAHIPKNVGKKIDYAMNTLKTVGFDYVTVFHNRQPEFIKID